MAVEGKTILQTMERTELTGKEGIPFQEGTQNGHVLVEKIKEYIGSDVYICPGVFQTIEGWSTTDVESIVGNYDDFYEATKNKIIVAMTRYGDIIVPIIGSSIIYGTDAMLVTSDYGSTFGYYITKESIVCVSNLTYIFTKDVINNLNSNSGIFPLSAHQGKILNEKIAEISNPASAEKNGLMSKEDKAKVDGIQFNTNENSVWFNGKKYGVILLKEDFLQLTESSSSTDIQAALGTFTFEYWEAAYNMGMTVVVQDTYSSYLGFIKYQVSGSSEYLDISLIDDSFGQLKSIGIEKNDSGYSVVSNNGNVNILSTDVMNDLTTNSADYPLSAAMGKKLQDEKLAKSDVVNNLTTADASKALSAAQGKALNDKIADFQSEISALKKEIEALKGSGA